MKIILKRNGYITGVVLSLLLGLFASCQPEMDFANPDADSDETYYNTKEHLIYAVNGAYNIIQRGGGWARMMPFILNNPSDEFIFTSGAAQGEWQTVQFSAYTTSSDNDFMSTSFSDFYVLQYAANLALEKLEINQDDAFDLTDAADKKLHDRLKGEAYFLRGLSRFYLTYIWGDELPDRDYVAKTNEEFYLPPSEPGTIYQNMIGDFKQAIELLPVRSEMYADPDDTGRATKGSAQGFLAKAYMARPLLDGTAGAGSAEWQLAKDLLWDIIRSGEYSLVDNYRDNSSEENENNIESLFEVQFSQSVDTEGYNPAANSDIASWTITGQNTIRAMEMTIPNSVAGFWWNAQPSLALYNEFERDAAGNIIDPRAYHGLWMPDGATWKGEDGVQKPYEQIFSGYETWHGKWFGSRKYTYDVWMPDIAKSGINDRLLRYADILLMYAECCIETNDETTALQYINMVRDRARKQTSPTDADSHLFYTSAPAPLLTAEQLITSAPTVGRVVGNDGTVIYPGIQINTVRRLLKHEYSVELYLEGWRYFNLLRWYNNTNDPDAADILSNLKNKPALQYEQSLLEGSLPYDYSKNRYLPIPANELNTNPNMKGNAAN